MKFIYTFILCYSALFLSAQTSESIQKFQIINRKWIVLVKQMFVQRDDVNALRVESIKSIRFTCNLNHKEVLNPRIIQDKSGTIEFFISNDVFWSITYKDSEYSEYLRDKKILEDLLFNK